MLSLPQLTANRHNALRSTGPRSSAGKAKASFNSLKHGIFAKDLLARESKDAAQAFQVLKDSVLESIQPRNALEAILAEKIAVDFWRLRKVLRFEVQSTQEAIQDGTSPQNYEASMAASQLKVSINTLHQEVFNAESILKALSSKSFQLCNVSKEVLAVISSSAYDVYRESLDSEAAHKLYYEEVSSSELLEIVGKTEGDFLKELKKHLEDTLPCLRQGLDQKLQAQQEFYKEQEARKEATLPSVENMDKISKYERSLQRSIMENIAILHKLQVGL